MEFKSYQIVCVKAKAEWYKSAIEEAEKNMKEAEDEVIATNNGILAIEKYQLNALALDTLRQTLYLYIKGVKAQRIMYNE